MHPMTTSDFPSDHEGEPLPLRLTMPAHTLFVALRALWQMRAWDEMGDLLNQARVAGYCVVMDDTECERLYTNLGKSLRWGEMLCADPGYGEPKWMAILRPRVLMSLYHAVAHAENMNPSYEPRVDAPYREW